MHKEPEALYPHATLGHACCFADSGDTDEAAFSGRSLIAAGCCGHSCEPGPWEGFRFRVSFLGFLLNVAESEKLGNINSVRTYGNLPSYSSLICFPVFLSFVGEWGHCQQETMRMK